jgi:hypothetical protein
MKFMNIFSVNKDKQNIFQIKKKYLGKRVVIKVVSKSGNNIFVFMSLSIPSETYEGRHNIFVFMSLSIPSETYEGRHNINKM